MTPRRRFRPDWWPKDSTGYELGEAELPLIPRGIEGLHEFLERRAPLGLTVEQWLGVRAWLVGALDADGVPRRELDIRLHGSAAAVFAGAHKPLPAPDDPRLEEPARSLLRTTWPSPTARPHSLLFDLGRRLGISAPSDLNININSTPMSDLAVDRFGHLVPSGDFRNGNGFITDYVLDQYAEACFPNLSAWLDTWQRELRRPITVRVFESSGPFDTSRLLGFSEHLRNTDWIVYREEG